MADGIMTVDKVNDPAEQVELENNILMYKSLFRSFRMNLKLLALKKLSTEAKDSIARLPGEFKVKFKFYNFERTQSTSLFFDPLTPETST